jgi:hypothetical protein
LRHPISLTNVCSCAGYNAEFYDFETLGFTITDGCEKRDIDECQVVGMCHPRATCVNHDMTKEGANIKYQCVCPTGWTGDGVSSCNLHTYNTKFRLARQDTSVATFLESTVRRDMIEGVEITVTIASVSEMEMESLTALVDLSLLPVQYTKLSDPISDVLMGGRNVLPTMLSGFAVDQVVFDATKNTWEIESRYTSKIPSTIISPFISKVGEATPYSQNVLDTFEISNFPCRNAQPSVCCLIDYKDHYITGVFGDDVTSILGSCDTATQMRDTLDLFDTHTSERFLNGLLTHYPNSSLVLTANNGLHLSLSNNDVTKTFSQRKNFPDGHYELKFFLGMAYITVLPAPILSSIASDVIITISVSPTLTFAFSSQQKYTFVQFLSMSVYQNRWMDSNFLIFNMQFVSIGVMLPVGLTQNMQTGLVPVNSIRFAIATTMPNRNDESAWINPCFSSSNTGMLDDDFGYPWDEMYKDAAAQQCAFDMKMCMNPIGSVLSNRMVNFNFPIGVDAISADMQNSGRYHLFAIFELSVLDNSNAHVVTEVFTVAPITKTSITRGCEQISSEMSLDSMTEVDIAVGLVGVESDWDNSMSIGRDIMHDVTYSSSNNFDTGVQHNSLASSLITIVIKAKPILQATNVYGSLMFTMDYLTTMHFLDDDKYNAVRLMMATTPQTAYTSDINNGHMEIRWTDEASESCSTGNNNLYSCAIRQSIVAGVATQTNGAHDFATPLQQSDDAGCASFITENLLGKNEFAQELATNMTSLVRSKFGIDNYLRKAWYVNPGYMWPAPAGTSATSRLHLTDKMIALAVVSMRDVSTGVIRSRRYLA